MLPRLQKVFAIIHELIKSTAIAAGVLRFLRGYEATRLPFLRP